MGTGSVPRREEAREQGEEHRQEREERQKRGERREKREERREKRAERPQEAARGPQMRPPEGDQPLSTPWCRTRSKQLGATSKA